MSATPPVLLRGGGVCVLLDVSAPALPRVLHWGADLGPDALADPAALAALLGPPVPHSGLDEPWPLTILPLESDGWSGHPGLQVHREGGSAAPSLCMPAPPAVTGDPETGQQLVASARDAAGSLEVRCSWRLDSHGVLRVSTRVHNLGEGLLDVAAVRSLVPLPGAAGEVLDFTGRWSRERSPQRSPLQQGTRMRASRRGRTGHDATGLLCVGTPGLGFASGEVWAAHVAWSGDHEHLVEALPEGAGGHAAVLGGGELLRPGEMRLTTGASYETPDVVFLWSGAGLDGLAQRLHRSLRARPEHPSSPRPLVLNTWEAVYFDTDTEHLLRLADVAAQVGVERFVLDDGWFGGRRDDTRALGDWTVSADVWSAGLHPLVDRVHGHGMQFGLWFEPEMVNADSDLVRAHPDWLLGRPGDPPPTWRGQHLLDLSRVEVVGHLLERLDTLVGEYAIDYLKWDHNRDLHDPVTSAHGVSDAPAVHRQTAALYGLLDELRRRHPALEIESCASGGARVDLGILERTDRVWASDCNDALERQQIQRWATQLLPPELVGTHVGPPTAHTTGRTLDLSFRLVTALFGHAGLEWDLTTCSPQELAVIRAFADTYRRLRPLLHGGRVVRADLVDDSAALHGVVSDDGGEAVFAYVQERTSARATPGAVRLPGLDPGRRYLLRVVTDLGLPRTVQTQPPRWWQTHEQGIEASGRVLTHLGVALPVLAPAQALLLELHGIPGPAGASDVG